MAKRSGGSWRSRWPSVASVAVAVVPPAGATQPGTGSLAAPDDEVTWTGGPFEAASPAPCTDDHTILRPVAQGATCCPDVGGTCDHFFLDIDAPGTPFSVEIEIQGPSLRDVDLYVYREDGTFVAKSVSPRPQEAVRLIDPEPGRYDVRTRANRVVPGETYQGKARLAAGVIPSTSKHQFHNDCEGYVPGAVGLRGLTDDGRTVSLDILVLLDGGFPLADAERLFAVASERSYEPLGIVLNPVFERIDVAPDGVIDRSGDEIPTIADMTLFRAAMARTTRPPAGQDLVFVLSDKDIWFGDSTQGEPAPAPTTSPARPLPGRRALARAHVRCRRTHPSRLRGAQALCGWHASRHVVLRGRRAKVAAHELGHLMGAQHDFSNCAEGLATELDEPEISPCTLMHTSFIFNSFNFDSVSAAIVPR